MKKGFTLIELLIVVANIAILAAIAVPNFIEAQTRAKVSRVQSDMRTLNMGLETYAVDHNSYPMCHRFGIATRNDNTEPLVLERLSTPVSYLSTVTFRDPFNIRGRLSASNANGTVLDASDPTLTFPGQDLVSDLNTYIYQSFSSFGRSQTTSDSFQSAGLRASAWVLHSAGPDSFYHNLGGILANDINAFGLTIDSGQVEYGTIDLMYDPTNGTSSFGSIYRVGGESGTNIQGNYAGGIGLMEAAQISSK